MKSHYRLTELYSNKNRRWTSTSVNYFYRTSFVARCVHWNFLNLNTLLILIIFLMNDNWVFYSRLCKVSKQNVSAPLLRCVSKQTYLKERDLWCRSSAVIYHENTMKIMENRRLSSIKGKEPVQVQPQKISLRLRPGEKNISSRFILSYVGVFFFFFLSFFAKLENINMYF